ncbi:MAG: hypothetical protein KGN16_02265 [Burkholderiales bacterium]|nr:hypothetical protein [Burkholderiales bacterium]
MPIIDVRPVVSGSGAWPEGIAQVLADAIAQVLSAGVARVWVRLAEIREDAYAENGTTVAGDQLPVFLEVLHAEWPDEQTRTVEAAALAQAVSLCLGRPVDRIHIEYAPPGRGRVAFGGRLQR